MKSANIRTQNPLVSLLVVLLLCGCASFRSSSPGSHENIHATAEHGYALLFDLLGDQKSVSKLLIIKRERAELRDLIKEISARSADAYKRLEAFAKTDANLNLKHLGLPLAEVATRESISKARGKELLRDKGKEFEVEMLLAQNEALTYGAHLAEVTARAENDPQRGRFLRELSGDLARLQQRVVAMLIANYSWSAK